MTVGLALSGGGSKGDFEVGAVRFLYDSGIRPTVIAGCSVGAINAVKLAEGEDPADPTRGLPGLEAIWSSLRTNSDMYGESAWLSGLPAEIKKAILGQVPISSLGPTTIPVAYFPDISQIRQAFINLAYVTSTGADILKTLESALTQAVSLFTLDPIQAKLAADVDHAKVADWAAQGNKLRLGMVALESGSLRYVTETGALVARDATTAVTAAPNNTCAAERQAVAAAQQALANAQKQIFAPGANKQAELGNVRAANEDLSQAQKALAACESAAPAAPAAVKTDLTTAVLASAAFPGFFPPVPIANETYVDGGVRALIPLDGAIRAGATDVYAISASPIPPDPAGGQWLMLDIAWRAVGLLESEIALFDSASSDANVTVHVIAPDLDLHSFDVVDPGLIQISRDYGYMRAADVVKNAAVNGPAWSAANAIASARLKIWSLENLCAGQPDPTNPAAGTPAASPALQAQIHQAKVDLAATITSRRESGGWVPGDIMRWTAGSELHPWVAAAPAVPSFSDQHVDFLTADGHVHELWFDINGWHTDDLTAATGAPAAAAGTALTGYTTNNATVQHINFLTADGHVHELWFDNAWHTDDLTAATGAPAAAAGTALTGYTTNNATVQHINFLTADGHVHELWFDNAWHTDDLTAATGAPAAAAGTALTGYTTSNATVQHINFLTADGHVHELWFDNAWHTDDLTAATGAPAAAAGTALTGYTTSNATVQHINFLTADGHVHELWFDNAWHTDDLTAATGAPAAAAGTALTGYTTSNATVQHINFLTADGHVHELWFDNAWHTDDLTAATGAPAAAAGTALTGYTTSNATVQHINFLTADGHVHELWFDNAWHTDDLTAATGAPAGGTALRGFETLPWG